MGVSLFRWLMMMERTLATLWDRSITLKASPPSAVVRAVDEELLTWAMESPSLSSSASVLCLDSQSIGCPANVECEFYNWKTSLLIGYRRCGPERHPVAGRRVSESRGPPWIPCCQLG